MGCMAKYNCVELLNLHSQMKNIRFHLHALLQDNTLTKCGYTINYIIDSHDMYQYSFSIMNAALYDTKYNIDSATINEHNWRRVHNMNLGYELFFENINENRNIVLLQTYTNELYRINNVFLTNNLIHDLLGKSIRTTICYGSKWWSLLNKINRNNHLSYKDRKSVVQLLQASYREILLLFLTSEDQGIMKIEKKLASLSPFVRYIEMSHNQIEEMIKNDDYMNVVTWYDKIKSLRDKYTSNRNDACALEFIRDHNRKANRTKSIYVLFSSSPIFQKFNDSFNEHNSGNIRTYNVHLEELPQEYNTLRTWRTYYYMSMCMGANENETINNINAKMKIVNRYWENNRGVEVLIQKIKEDCEYYNSETDRLENTQPEICTRCKYAKQSNIVRQTMIEQRKVISQLENLMSYNTNNNNDMVARISKDIRCKWIKVDEEISKMVKSFASYIVDNNSFLKQKTFEQTRSLQVDLDKITSILPMHVERVNTMRYTISELLDFSECLNISELKAIIKNGIFDDPNKYIEIYHKIDELVNGDTNNNLFVKLSVAYSVRNIERCVAILKDANSSQKDDFKYKYFKSLVDMQLALSQDNYKELRSVIESTQGIMQSHPNDIHAIYLHGIIIVKACERGYYNVVEMQKMVKTLFSNVFRMYKAQEPSYSRNHILNLAGYLLATASENLKQQRMKYGNEIVNEIKTIDERDMLPRYMHTIGCLQLRMGIDEINIYKRCKILERAEIDIKLAIEKAKEFGVLSHILRKYESSLKIVQNELREYGWN